MKQEGSLGWRKKNSKKRGLYWVLVESPKLQVDPAGSISSDSITGPNFE